jgi:hypothetical protein
VERRRITAVLASREEIIPMTRLFLAAGVAALAITAPASARPGGGHGGSDRQASVNQNGGGGQRAQRQERAQARAQSPQRAERVQMRAERPQRQERVQMRAERSQQPRFQAQAQHTERVQMRAERQARPARVDRTQTRVAERQQVRQNEAARTRTRVADRQQLRTNRAEQVQTRTANRQQLRGNRTEQVQTRTANRQQLRSNRPEQVQNRVANRQQLQANRFEQAQNRVAQRGQFQANQFARAQDRIAARNQFRAARIDRVRAFDPLPARFTARQTRIVPVGDAYRVVGLPVSRATQYVSLAALPASAAYLYPDTPNYYYRYGDGYLYQVNRQNNLIDYVLPMLAGGYLPGQYLPTSYMNSYAPSYYGYNNFYQDYGDNCYRYAYGNMYDLNCSTGLIDDVIPTYAGGYGVGQILPSSYGYYNVPSQYRPLYYDTPNYGYWYAPGAIYQYNPTSSLITSVAALLSPGFAVGQPLPTGYNAYNVPLGYRDTYYDTSAAYYRYNNGYIYQVDPTTMLVTAIVASALS